MTKRVLSPLLILLAATAALTAGPQDSQDRRREESRDYFAKWLNEDVKYIIADEEKEIFQKLQTDQEKERFIEQFWRRRDPDPRTAANEFKEEHYRRIAYANEHFSSGFAGWKTDRGRVYILYGPPDSKDGSVSGGAYERPFHEGGGGTATFPFEIWRYKYIEGLGDNVELEFVDKSWTGDFQLALSADEKDVFLNVAGHGNTKAEQLGMATRIQRLSQSPALRELYPMMQHRIKDSPFQRYETYARVQAVPVVKYKDLQESVRVDLSYQELPFQVHADFFKLNDRQVLVPVTLEFPNRELGYTEENGLRIAKIGLYGRITSVSNQVVFEFEDDISSGFRPEAFEAGLRGRTVYQKTLLLEQNLRYKLDLVVKDLKSGSIGTLSRGLAAPAFPEGDLKASGLVLADYIEQLAQQPAEQQMFVLGDFKVRPSVGKIFPGGGVLGLYLQLYGAEFDQASQAPSLETTFSLWRDGRKLFEEVDPDGASAFFYSDRRVVLIKALPLADIDPGECRVVVQIKDRIRGQTLAVEDRFRVVAPAG